MASSARTADGKPISRLTTPVKVLKKRSEQARYQFLKLIDSVFRQRQLQTPRRSVPPELIERILGLLTTPDQICFGLSCRYIFACLERYLKTQGMKICELFPPEERVMLCPNAKEKPRIQLLLRLKNDRWKYCHDCSTLHPSALCRVRPQKPCCFKCYFLKADFQCMPYAGKVDICPCTSITFRDKLHLIRQCKDTQTHILRPGEIIFGDNVPLNADSRKPYGNLRHDCEFTGHSSIGVRIRTDFWLSEMDMSLCVINQYEFKTLHESPSVSLSTIPVCSYKDIKSWVRRVFHDGGSSFRGWDKSRSTRLLEHRGWERVKSWEDTYTSQVMIFRNLGNWKWPNKDWTNHSNH